MRVRLSAFSLLSVAWLAAAAPAGAQIPDWPYDDQYQARLTFLHAFVNYAPSPHWERDWERNLLARSGVRFTVGSITSRDFLTDADVNVNERLGDTRFRFVYRMDWLEAQHVEVDGVDQMAGFEVRVAGPLGVEAVIHPRGDKEFMDMAFGVVLTDADRERYLRASVRFDDFVWGEKNDRDGRYDRKPLALRWTGRMATDSWELFTRGSLGRPYERAYPDAAVSPDVATERFGASGAELRVRYLTRPTSFAELELSWYDFEDAQAWRVPSDSYDYTNRILNLSGRYAFSFGGGAWRAWPGVRLLVQDAAASGRRAYDFRRVDWMPSAFVEWFPSPTHSVEMGYMASAGDGRLDDRDPAASFDERTWSDKIKLGWTYHFTPLSRLQISLSHELAFEKFGGGNVQFITFF